MFVARKQYQETIPCCVHLFVFFLIADLPPIFIATSPVVFALISSVGWGRWDGYSEWSDQGRSLPVVVSQSRSPSLQPGYEGKWRRKYLSMHQVGTQEWDACYLRKEGAKSLAQQRSRLKLTMENKWVLDCEITGQDASFTSHRSIGSKQSASFFCFSFS